MGVSPHPILWPVPCCKSTVPPCMMLPHPSPCYLWTLPLITPCSSHPHRCDTWAAKDNIGISKHLLATQYCTLRDKWVFNLHMDLTLNLTSCKFYLILISLSPIYDPHPPCLHWIIAAKWFQFHHSPKNWVLGRFPLPFGLQTTYRIFKNRFRMLISRRFWTYL